MLSANDRAEIFADISLRVKLVVFASICWIGGISPNIFDTKRTSFPPT